MIRAAIDTLACWEDYGLLELKHRLAVRRPASTGEYNGLLVVRGFPPTVTGGVYRPTALLRRAGVHGWNLTVIAREPSEPITEAGRYLTSKIPSDATVLRIPECGRRPSWRVFPRIDGGLQNVAPTVRAGLKIANRTQFAIVMASGPPFYTFVAAYYLARRLGAKLVLEYRDEWTECPFGFVRTGNADRRWEKRCLDAADAVIFTTRAQRDHQIEVFSPNNPTKCIVIPNGWEPEDVELESRKPSTPDSRVFAFIGNLGDHTLPDEFLFRMERVFARDPELRSMVRLAFVGQKSRRAQAMLAAFRYPENLKLVEHVPKSEVGRIMTNSSGLLIFATRDLERYIPGKLYSYVAAGRPILCFGDRGEISRLVRETGSGSVIDAHDEAALARALRGWPVSQSDASRPAARDSWLAKHARSVLADQTFGVLTALMGGTPGTFEAIESSSEVTDPGDDTRWRQHSSYV